MSKWNTEVHQTEDGEAISVGWGPSTPGGYADLYCVYGFFETEQEAAEDFLTEVAQNPEARYRQDQYQHALELVRANKGDTHESL